MSFRSEARAAPRAQRSLQEVLWIGHAMTNADFKEPLQSELKTLLQKANNKPAVWNVLKYDGSDGRKPRYKTLGKLFYFADRQLFKIRETATGTVSKLSVEDLDKGNFEVPEVFMTNIDDVKFELSPE